MSAESSKHRSLISNFGKYGGKYCDFFYITETSVSDSLSI